ncbi:hypothetical protein RND81_09G028900 [Saponaria officinalis]|uniref:Uncharacterized protein n=1 Tax=Saponaria officinalis TaxID=3572 RepID=A0AAW1IGX7_SAPOF
MNSATNCACRSKYIVTTTMAAVEALKDQGFARWNYPLRRLHQRLKNSVRSLARPVGGTAKMGTVVKTERTLYKVMELDCWGPTTTRF